MLRTYFIIILFLICIVVYPQTTRFNHIYEPFDSQTSSTILCYENGYIVCGLARNNSDPGAKIKYVVYYLDSIGNLQWFKSYGDSIYNHYDGVENSLIENTDGGFSLSGAKIGSSIYACRLIKFDHNFDTLWTRSYFTDSNFKALYNHIQLPDGGYLLVGTINFTGSNADMLMIRTDQMGNVIWYKSHHVGTHYDHALNVIQTSDMGYLVGGFMQGNSSALIGGVLLKTDSAGNEEWRRVYGNSLYSDGSIGNIISTRDSGYVFEYCYGVENVAATSFVNYVYRIVKLDKDYNQMWEKEYGELSMYSGIGSVIEANNGDLVVTVVDNQKAGLFRMTADGDSLWKYYYHSGDSTMDHGLICEKQTDDMGFVLTGEVYFPQKVWVVKVDSCGCDTAGCICNYSMIFEPEPGKIQAIVYPNPASDYIYVNSEHIIGMNIYTLTGEKLMGSEGVPFINISILESGVYIVRIITKSGAINKKIIKQ